MANAPTTTAPMETASQQRAPRVLLAEDDTRMRQLLASTLRRDGFEVTELQNGAELLDWIGELHLHPTKGEDRPVDLIITDIRMPILSGLDVLTELRWDGLVIPVIVITAFGDEDTHAKATSLGAVAVFDKPFELDDIRRTARYHAYDR